MRDRLASILHPSDALLVVPPFAGVARPSLAAHVLQACAAVSGHRVTVLYANLVFAAYIGERKYQALSHAPSRSLVGEHVFAPHPTARTSIGARGITASTGVFVDELVDAVLTRGFRVVGCSTTFQQTAASIAILREVKQRAPEVTTIIGGANCDGEMAAGIRDLAPEIDFVFSGECETVFPDFLSGLGKGGVPSHRIVRGSPCRDLDAIPPPDYAEYYEQVSALLSDSDAVRRGTMWLPYETSRGCWWGQKSHCTFCGLNGTGMTYRAKSPDKVIRELRTLVRRHPTRLVSMVDNIMPYEYFRTLLPRVARELPGLHVFYEQKANLDLAKMKLLREAGVLSIQPGVEALSTPLLRLMRKGVTAAQNVTMMRFARITGIDTTWNLLYSFPGDRIEWYEDTLALVPLLRHLWPPTGVTPLGIDRFSPYFERPEQFGITNLRPVPSYRAAYRTVRNHTQLAYHFEADYDSESRPDENGDRDVILRLKAAADSWAGSWREGQRRPCCSILPVSRDCFVLADSRWSAEPRLEIIDGDRARACLLGAATPAAADWALRRRVAVELDGQFVPLATTALDLFESLAGDTEVSVGKVARHGGQSVARG